MAAHAAVQSKGSNLPRGTQMLKALANPGARILLLFLALSLSPAGYANQPSGSRASEVQVHLQRGQAALRANDPAAAVKEYREVLNLEPKSAEAYANLGVVAFFFERDYPRASKYFGRALEINPSLVKIQALQGICEMRLGNSSGQLLLERSFPKLKDRRLRTQVGMVLASLYYRQGALGRAASVALILVDLNPDNLNVLFMAQRIYSDLAHKTMNKLAVLAPGSAQMQEVIAERLVNNGDLQDAIDHYKKALAIDPDLSGVHFELGEAILQFAATNAQYQAAKQQIEMAERMEGDKPGIECALGEIALRQSKPDDAYAHYRRAFAMDPESATADLGMGKVLMTMEKPRQAIRYLQMAVRSDSLNADAHYRLAQVYRRLDLTAKSKKEFRLFQDIKQTKDRVWALYGEMNRRPQAGGTQGAAATKPN